MLPKDDYLGIKQLVEWDSPRALSAPQRGTKANQPGTVSRAGELRSSIPKRVSSMLRRVNADGSSFNRQTNRTALISIAIQIRRRKKKKR